MKIDEERVGDVTILAFVGEFDNHYVPDAVEKLDGLFKKELRLQLVFDLSKLDFITSSGLSFFIDSVKRVRRLDGDLVVSRPSRLLKKTVETLDVGEFFTVYASNEEAIAHFRSESSP
jgi:anti-sigma B factor antagonist